MRGAGRQEPHFEAIGVMVPAVSAIALLRTALLPALSKRAPEL